MHLKFGTEGMAAVAKAPLFSKLIFCRVCGSNPAVDRNMSTIFLYRLFHIFSSYEMQRGVHKLCRPFSGPFWPLIPTYVLAYYIASL